MATNFVGLNKERGNYPWVKRLAGPNTEFLMTPEEAEKIAQSFRRIGFTCVDVVHAAQFDGTMAYTVKLHGARGITSITTHSAARSAIRRFRGSSQVI